MAVLELEWLEDREKPIVIVESLESRPWSSVSFTGEQLSIDMRLIGAADRLRDGARRLAATAATLDAPLPGRFLADLAVTRVVAAPSQLRLRLEALVLDE